MNEISPWVWVGGAAVLGVGGYFVWKYTQPPATYGSMSGPVTQPRSTLPQPSVATPYQAPAPDYGAAPGSDVACWSDAYNTLSNNQFRTYQQVVDWNAAHPSCRLPLPPAPPGTSTTNTQLNRIQGQSLPDGATTLDAQESQFLRLINQYRSNQGLHELTPAPLLNAVAYQQALEMATHHYLSHTSLDGRSPFDRMTQAGYTSETQAENIACGHPDAQATFEQWRASPSHDENMRNPVLRAIGIAVVPSDGTCQYYWVTDFGDVVQ